MGYQPDQSLSTPVPVGGAAFLTSHEANPEYLSVNWDASGGGAFAVIPLNERGRLPEQLPLFRGHTSVVLDTDWYYTSLEELNES